MNHKKEIKLHKHDNSLRLVTGVVYEPDTVDLDGDYASSEAIREAAHAFLADYRVVKLMHQHETPGASVVESYLAPVAFQLGDAPVKAGAWLVVLKIHDDELWRRIQDGHYTGLSMGGLAERQPVHEEAVAV